MASRSRYIAREYDGADWVAYRASEKADNNDNATMSSSSRKQYWKEFDPMSMPKASSSLTSPLLGMTSSNYGYTALGSGKKTTKKKGTNAVDESDLVLCCRKSCFQFLSLLFAVATVTFFILWSAGVSIYTPTTMGLNGPVSFSSSQVDIKWDSDGGKALVKLPIELAFGVTVLNSSNYAFGMFNFAADALDGGVVHVGEMKGNKCSCSKRSVGKIMPQTEPISPAVWEIAATATDGTCFRHGDTKPTAVTFYTGKWNSLLYLIPSSFDASTQFPKLLMGLYTEGTTNKNKVACAALNTTESSAMFESLSSAITCKSPYCDLRDIGATIQYGEKWESKDSFVLPKCCNK